MNEYETPIDQIRPVSASDKKIDMNSIMKYESEMQQQPQMMQQQPQMMQQQSPQINTVYEHQQFPMQVQPPKMKPKEKEYKEIDLNEILNKDNIYLVLAISILFSDSLQNHISKLLPNLYMGDKISFIGILIHAIIVVVGLFLIKKINIKIGN